MSKPQDSERVGGAYFEIGGDTDPLKKGLDESMRMTVAAFASMKTAGSGFGQVLTGLGTKAGVVGGALAGIVAMGAELKKQSGSVDQLAAAMGTQGEHKDVKKRIRQIEAFGFRNAVASTSLFAGATQFFLGGGKGRDLGKFLKGSVGTAEISGRSLEQSMAAWIELLTKGRSGGVAGMIPGMSPNDMDAGANIQHGLGVSAGGLKLRKKRNLKAFNIMSTLMRTGVSAFELFMRRKVANIDDRFIGGAADIGQTVSDAYDDATGASASQRSRSGVPRVRLDRAPRSSAESLNDYRYLRARGRGTEYQARLRGIQGVPGFEHRSQTLLDEISSRGMGLGGNIEDVRENKLGELDQLFREIRDLLREANAMKERRGGLNPDPRQGVGVDP